MTPPHVFFMDADGTKFPGNYNLLLKFTLCGYFSNLCPAYNLELQKQRKLYASMSPTCFLCGRIKNTQKKTVTILCRRTGFLEQIDNGF